MFTADTDSRDPIKAENVPLSVTYDQGQEATYIPTPYATSRVSGYNPGNEPNIGTFGSTRSGYTYNVPNPPRRVSRQLCVKKVVSFKCVYYYYLLNVSNCDVYNCMLRFYRRRNEPLQFSCGLYV